MADENKTKPSGGGTPRWLLFVLPALLAVIGVYLALTRPAPNAAQQKINAAAGIPAEPAILSTAP